MDIKLFLLILDAMIAYITASENEKQNLRDLLVEKDKIIEAQQAQIATASTMLVVEETELRQVHSKLSEVAELLLPEN